MGKQTIAVVITVKNDAAALQELLVAIEQQTLIPDEVVITVAQSHDHSLKTAQQWLPNNIDVRVISQGQLTRAEGRNLGVSKAKSEIIVFTDAGCLPEPNWLKELTTPIINNHAELVSGLTWVKSKNAWEEAQAPFILVPPDKINPNPLPSTRNMAIKKSTFNIVGGFNSKLNYAEDYELARRLAQQNILADFKPTAVVWWQPRHSLTEYFQMIVRLTSGDVHAKTWRFGHLTMVLRYAFFIFLPVFFRIWTSWSQAVLLSLSIYFFYLFIKTVRFTYRNWKSYLWAPLLQLLTDLAVIYGLGLSILSAPTTRKRSKK